MYSRHNPIIENTSSAESTSTEDTYAEMQHEESTETHVGRNKIKTTVVNIEEIKAILLDC